jgi:hypothetical protein
MSVYRTDDVFGISRAVPLNYVSRANADHLFINALTRWKHIVLHGSSKQGKTSLRKECLASGDSITVQCLSSWDLASLHAAILKEAGFVVEQSQSKTERGTNKVSLKLQAGITLPVIGKLGGETDRGSDRTSEFKPLELDVEDVNDVIRALGSIGFKQFVTLEDFHYLPDDTQRNFATALKAYHELSRLCFIVVGVWLEHDRLAVYNGDLSGRLSSVNVDTWSSDDLRSVISKGEALLNIEFPAAFKDELIERCLESVYIVQETCNRACIEAEIYETQERKTPVQISTEAGILVRTIVDEQAARYRSALSRFADGYRDTELEMHKWILYPVLDASIQNLEQGLRYRDIKDKILEKHPLGDGLNLGNLTIALQKAAGLQVKKGIKPIILDYDQTSSRLGIVDRSFLVWLSNQDRTELKRELDLPAD